MCDNHSHYYLSCSHCGSPFIHYWDKNKLKLVTLDKDGNPFSDEEEQEVHFFCCERHRDLWIEDDNNLKDGDYYQLSCISEDDYINYHSGEYDGDEDSYGEPDDEDEVHYSWRRQQLLIK